MGLLLTAGLWAQSGNNEMFGHAAKGGAKSITFSASDIEFWTGTGTNQAIYVLAWDDDPYNNDTALAWGVRWNGSATATSLLDTIVAYDSRFSYTLSGSLMTDMSFNDGTINPGSSMNGWCYYHNGSWGMYAWPNQPMSNGDMIEMSSSCMFTMTSATAVSNPNNTDPVDATIDTSDIVFWVGSGSNSAVLIVNWGDPDTAFAWGFRFNGSVTAQTMVDSIAAADPRFWTVGSPSLSGDIHYILSNGDTLGLVDGSSTSMGYNFWWTNINGVSAGSGAATSLHNGYVFKYGDLSVGTGWDPMGTYFMEYAWEKTPTPAPLPTDDPETPEDATIDTSDIVYWVGTGSNALTFVVNWADTALAWGYRFSEDSVTLSTVMNNIAMADPRFSYSGEGMISDINYVENGDTLGITPGNWWGHLLNGVTSAGMFQWMHNGDLSRWFDPAAGVVVDSVYHDDWGGWWEYIYAFPQRITPVSLPAPTDASISASEIEYWIGEGDNEVIFVVNWADTALAWGYRFADDSVTLATMMDDIVAADSRFSYSGEGMVSDINYVENGDTLGITPGNWWEHSINGITSMGMSQWFHDGDMSRWADPAAGIAVDSFYYEGWGWIYTYVYPQHIYPVSNPEPEEGPFCGIVGTEGCTAIALDDVRIKGWATGCTVVRGSSNLSDPNAADVSYGDESAGVGPASTSTLEAVSLGDGGMATLTFGTPIANGDGFDFAVFENSFDDYFLELAVVEVSSDGEHFVRFPATSLTQTRTQIGDIGRVDATFINNLAGKYRVGYGTPFDLEELRDSTNIDINNITHVRLIDVVGSIDPQYGTYDAFGHIINDPFPTISRSAGFDLEGVCVLNQQLGIKDAEATTLNLFPNPARNLVSITMKAEAAGTVAIYDMTGRQVLTLPVQAGNSTIRINTADMPNGVYMVSFGNHVEKLVVRH